MLCGVCGGEFGVWDEGSGELVETLAELDVNYIDLVTVSSNIVIAHYHELREGFAQNAFP